MELKEMLWVSKEKADPSKAAHNELASRNLALEGKHKKLEENV